MYLFALLSGVSDAPPDEGTNKCNDGLHSEAALRAPSVTSLSFTVVLPELKNVYIAHSGG